MRKIVKYPLLLLLFYSLILIRAYGEQLFYDPFIVFFKNDYLYSAIPEFEFVKLIYNIFVRYVLNSLISLGIIYIVFEKLNYLLLSIKLYILGFAILIIAYSILLGMGFEKGYLLPFYIRRFLIHPLFLLVLLAALYYDKLAGGQSR